MRWRDAAARLTRTRQGSVQKRREGGVVLLVYRVDVAAPVLHWGGRRWNRRESRGGGVDDDGDGGDGGGDWRGRGRGGGDAKARVTRMTLTTRVRMTGTGGAGADAEATQHSALQRNHTTHEQ